MPKLIDHGRRRAELIEASWNLIAADGVYGATVRHVAERAHLDPGSVRYIFPSQDQLLLAAAAELHERVRVGAVRRADDYSRPEQAAFRLAAALPSDNERQLEWRVERAFRFGANQLPALAPTVRACRETRLVEVREVLAVVASELDVSEQTLGFEVQRTHALTEGLGELLSDDAVSRTDARQTLLTHLHGTQENWRLGHLARVREVERLDAARARAL